MSSNTVAICIGLTAVNPYAYGGWAGDCPGCDVDAKGLYSLLVSKGFKSTLILNSEATWTNVRAKILEAANSLKNKDDLLVVTMSGHGGQLQDDNGDEVDGQDETLCLWDGQVRDDEMLKLIRQFPAIRLMLINDQCHSEGNFRAILRSVQQTVSLGAWGKRSASPLIDKTGLKRDTADWGGQLIQFAGCREDNYSYGASAGGTWTQSLLRKYSDNLTWRGWFDSSIAIMPGNQVPQWVEYGSVQDSFRTGQVLK
jgi:hypothetical protein